MKCYHCKKREAQPILCLECSSKIKIAKLRDIHFSRRMPRRSLITLWRTLKFRIKNRHLPKIRWEDEN